MPRHSDPQARRVLYVGIDFYDYPAEIAAAFERAGTTVDFRPIEGAGFWAKSTKKFLPDLYRKRLDAYHRGLVEESRGTRYDTIVFIQVHHVAHDTMAALRAAHPEARFVLYNWDSLTTHDFRPWLRHFDAAWTFDAADAEATEGVGYLPLFAIPQFFAIDRGATKDFDLYFVGAIGTMHRFDALARLAVFARDHALRLKLHLRCSPAIRLALARRGKRLDGLTLRSIGMREIIDLIERSRATFDFANHRQSGYTMRFIENMCAGTKIVTENRCVLTEDFYRDDRFLVVENLDFSAVPAFLARPITSSLDTTRFSIDNWARKLLER